MNNAALAAAVSLDANDDDNLDALFLRARENALKRTDLDPAQRATHETGIQAIQGLTGQSGVVSPVTTDQSAERLDCAVCGAVGAAEIDPDDPSRLICHAEQKTWQLQPGPNAPQKGEGDQR